MHVHVHEHQRVHEHQHLHDREQLLLVQRQLHPHQDGTCGLAYAPRVVHGSEGTRIPIQEPPDRRAEDQHREVQEVEVHDGNARRRCANGDVRCTLGR